MLAVDSEALWYFTRGTGVVSMLLLTLVVVLGIAQVHGWAVRGWPQLVVAGLHKNASLLVVVFLGLHIASTVVDGFAPVGWVDAVVPFASAYRPVWLGLGALSFDLILAIVVTSLLRRHLSHRAWRTVHWLAYASWPVAFVHGLGTGTDGTTAWVLAIDAVCLAAVIGAVVWRILTAQNAGAARRWGAGILTGGATIFVVSWTLAGPMSAGWARRAGTPLDLLASSDDPVSNGGPDAANGPSTTELSPPFTAILSGTLTETRSTDGRSHLTVDGTLRGGVDGRLHLEMAGPSAAPGGLRVQTSQLTFGPEPQPALFSGQVSSWRGSIVTATVRDQTNTATVVTITLTLDRTAGTASGSVVTGSPKPGG